MAGVSLENLLGSHLAHGRGDAGTHQVQHVAAPDEVHQRDDDQPHQEGAAADDEGIFKADDIAQSQHGRAGVHLQDQLGLVGHGCAPAHHRGGDGLGPGAEGGDHEVVQTADETGGDKGLGTGTAALTADEHLRGGGGFRERILSVHLLHEVLAERDQEQDAQHAAQQRAADHFPEIHLHAQDVDGGQGEDGAGHNGSAAAADALDDDILRETLLQAQGAGQTHGDDGDGDGCLEHLAHLEAEVCRSGAEQDNHQDTNAYRIRSGFGVFLRGIQDGLVRFAGFQFPVRVLRKGDGFLIFHCVFVFAQI